MGLQYPLLLNSMNKTHNFLIKIKINSNKDTKFHVYDIGKYKLRIQQAISGKKITQNREIVARVGKKFVLFLKIDG